MPESIADQPDESRPNQKASGVGIRFTMGLIGAITGSVLGAAFSWIVIALWQVMFPPVRGRDLDLSPCCIETCLWPLGGVLGATFSVLYVAPRMAPSTKK